MDTPTDMVTTTERGQLMMLPPLDLTLMLMPGTAMATMDTGLMDTDTGTARGQLMRRPLPLDPTLMRRLTPMDGTAMDMDPPTDTDTPMARGLLMMPPPLDPMLTLMLMPGMDMAATTDTGLMDTDTGTARGQLM